MQLLSLCTFLCIQINIYCLEKLESCVLVKHISSVEHLGECILDFFIPDILYQEGCCYCVTLKEFCFIMYTLLLLCIIYTHAYRVVQTTLGKIHFCTEYPNTLHTHVYT